MSLFRLNISFSVKKSFKNFYLRAYKGIQVTSWTYLDKPDYFQRMSFQRAKNINEYVWSCGKRALTLVDKRE